MIAYTVHELPKWNPINICSYHLQEAGATPVQEIAYALCTAVTVLDAVRDSQKVKPEDFSKVVGRISFFVNAGIRFVEEACKMRAFVRLWDEITRTRYGVTDPKYRIFRYGVQVNSLGLTERQPENNIARILYEMLAVTISKDARARAVQLPAWNEALGLPRPWDQQLSLRMQQILAYETDLLEYGDLFEGSKVIEEKVASLVEAARKEMTQIESLGGLLKSIDFMKQSLVASHAERIRRIETGDLKVVGVNCYTESETSLLTTGKDEGFLKVDPKAEREQIKHLNAFRKSRDELRVKKALQGLVTVARNHQNIMPVSIATSTSAGIRRRRVAIVSTPVGTFRVLAGRDSLNT